MEKRFRTGKENHSIDNIIDSNHNEIELIGWSSDDEVVIENWSFINYKRKPKDVYKNDTSKWVHLNQITFKNCIFKDVNFVGGVPIDGCTFKNCIFENCLLADHIRDSEFKNCSFDFCIFAGYFHRSKFPKCKINKVLMEYYTDRAVSGLKDVNICTEKERIEILKYFYPEEAKVFDNYKKGDIYFVKKFENSFFRNYDKDFNYVKIDGKDYFKDIVEEIKFDLTHYEPKVRIIGRYAPLVNECKSIE